MIKAIIFDCFGVLTTEGWHMFRDKHFGGDEAALAKLAELNYAADDGELPFDQFIKQVAAMAGVTPGEVGDSIRKVTLDTRLMDYINDQLKPHYKIGMLSNVPQDWLDELFSTDQLALFDAVGLSYEMGFTKPDPRAYMTIAKRLKVESSECLFIDDSQTNTRGAEAVGMTAVKYESLSRLQQSLKEALY
jgi:putative hydrolase of the HAD superfamily